MIRFKLHQGAKSTVHELPENWTEIQGMGKKLSIVRVLLRDMDEYSCRVAILKILLNVSDKTFKRIPDSEIARLTIKLKWVSIAPSPTPILTQFTHNGNTYYLPKADFTNGSAVEWVLALEQYEGYAESQSPEDLVQFVAVLARERSIKSLVPFSDERAAIVTLNDIRVPIYDNSAQIENRAKRLKGLSDEISICVLRYFEGVKLMFHNLGIEAELWTEPDPNKPEEKPQGVALFGWRTTFRAIAEKGPFGTDYETVSQRKFWEIFQYLLERKAANDAHEAELKKIQQND